jgi:hypothetical protein
MVIPRPVVIEPGVVVLTPCVLLRGAIGSGMCGLAVWRAVEAALPAGIVITPPATDVREEKARWSGRWRGWACNYYSCDTKLVVETVVGDGATIVFAYAAPKEKPITTRLQATFVGNELQAILPGGASVAYRMRACGDIEFMYRRDARCSAGVLSDVTPAVAKKSRRMQAQLNTCGV